MTYRYLVPLALVLTACAPGPPDTIAIVATALDEMARTSGEAIGPICPSPDRADDLADTIEALDPTTIPLDRDQIRRWLADDCPTPRGEGPEG